MGSNHSLVVNSNKTPAVDSEQNCRLRSPSSAKIVEVTMGSEKISSLLRVSGKIGTKPGYKRLK